MVHRMRSSSCSSARTESAYFWGHADLLQTQTQVFLRYERVCVCVKDEDGEHDVRFVQLFSEHRFCAKVISSLRSA